MTTVATSGCRITPVRIVVRPKALIACSIVKGNVMSLKTPLSTLNFLVTSSLFLTLPVWEEKPG